jgi:hypothetical protein
MKLNLSVWKLSGAVLLANFILFGVLAETASGQTTRRSTKTRKPVTTAQPVVPNTQTEPQIISRADEFPDENQIVTLPPVETAQTETASETQPATNENLVNELSARIKNLESGQKNDDAKQKRLMLNLDILTRSEQRAETLRKQMWDMIERENQISTKLDQLETDSRPEVIERQIAFAGSLRPEELREMRRKNLDAEKRNLQNLLTEIRNTKSNLEANVQKADALVERLRAKLEKEIDDALAEEPEK